MEKNICIERSRFANEQCPQRVRYNGAIYALTSSDSNKCCYTIIAASGGRRRKSTPTPPPPLCVAPTIELFTPDPFIIAPHPNPFATVYAVDVILNISGGSAPYTYEISKDGITWSAPSLDPSIPSVQYDCSELGPQIVYVRVTSACGTPGGIGSDFGQTAILIDDPNLVCEA